MSAAVRDSRFSKIGNSAPECAVQIHVFTTAAEHAIPKYLRGAAEQELAKLPSGVRRAYHTGPNLRQTPATICLSFAKTSSDCPTRSGASEIRGQDAEPGWR